MDIVLNKFERNAKAGYTVKAILHSRSPHGNQKKWKHGDVVYHQVTARSFDVKAPKIFSMDVFRKHIIDSKGNQLWKVALNILMTNKDFK